jgi:hypothetical protein
MNNEIIAPKGEVEAVIEYLDREPEIKLFKNTILKNGRIALAKSLANEIGDTYDFFISRMQFGSSGTTGGVPKFVNADRNALFGTTELSKPVSASRDESRVIFTSVITFSELVATTLNEMALQMNNGDLYSMVTFPDFTKTAQMQVTYNWNLQFI